MADPTIVAQAREWIDRVDAGRGLSNNWRLQVIQKRYRKRDVPQDTGTALPCDGDSCVGLPMRIRRFVPGCPWALVDQAIRYLICKAPYTGIIYNGLEIPGTYRPTLTTWQRDEQSTVDEQKPQNGTYTLIQDLVEEGCEDEETVVTGETCSYVETTEYHWDDSTPGELPGCGSECAGTGVCQGVTYAIRSQRNDDGTFDWQLVKRVAKTQHAGPVDIECNGCTGRVTQETWDNLYGDAESGFRDDCGNAADLPGCDDEPGVKTQVQFSQNPDCTYRLVVTRRENLEYVDEWTDGTSCRTRTVVDSHNLRSLPDMPSPEVGETVRVQLKRNDDCTYDVQTETTSAPEELEYSWTDGNDCRPRTVTVLRDMREMPAVPEVGPGETLEASVSRNQDCTWDAQFSVRLPAKDALIEWDQGSECRPQHVMSYQNSADIPEVPRPAAGRTVTASIRRNDDCTYDGQVTVTEPSAAAEYGWTQGSACQAERVTAYQNSADMPQVPAPGPGQTVSASIRRNDDCTYDGQVTVREGMPDDVLEWTEGSECRLRRVTRTMNSRTVPEIPEPTGGRTVQASVSRNSDCTYDSQVTVTEPGSSEPVTYVTGTACTKVTEVAVRNAAEPLEIPVPAQGQTVQGNVSRQDDCTYDSRYSVTESQPDELSWTEGSQCRKVESHHLLNQRSYSVPEAGQGQSVSASVSKNADCTYDVSYKVTNPYGGADVTWEDGPRCKRRRHTQWIDQAERPQIADGGDGQTVQASLSFDPGSCTWSGQQVVQDALTLDETLEWEDGASCQRRHHKLIFDSPTKPEVAPGADGETVQASFSFNEQNCTWNGQVTRVEAAQPDDMHWTEGSSCRRVEAHHLVNQKSFSVPEAGQGQSVSASVSKNADCTYDVSYKVTNPYGGADVTWEDGPECKRRHHTLWIDKSEKPAVSSGGNGETVQASLSFDPGSCTWSGQQVVTGAFLASTALQWDDGSACQKRHHTLYIDSTEMPDVSGGEGQTVQASLSFNDQNCTWNGQVTKIDKAESDCMTWTEGTGCQPVSSYHCVNADSAEVPVQPDENTKVSAHVSKNADCTYDVTYKVEHAAQKDSGWVTWDSETKTAGGLVAKYHNGTRVFKNLDSVPIVPHGTNASVSVSVNEYCKFDGTMSYSDLYEWHNPSASSGGIRNGKCTFTEYKQGPGGRPVSITSWYDVVAFIGSGNEGTEAEYLIRGYISLGGGNGIRAYRSPAPDNEPRWDYVHFGAGHT